MTVFATFVGENADGFVSLWGCRFETGAEVLVEDANAIRRIRRNFEFEWRNHDFDGRKAGRSMASWRQPPRHGRYSP